MEKRGIPRATHKKQHGWQTKKLDNERLNQAISEILNDKFI